MASKTNMPLVVGGLVGLYLLLREPAAVSPSSSTPSSGGAGGGGSGGGFSSTISTVEKGAAAIAGGGAVVAKVVTGLGAAAPTVGLVGAAVALEAGGIYLGAKTNGVPGAVVGGLNPVTGTAVNLGYKAGSTLAKDAGANTLAQQAAGGSSGLLAGVATLADIATAAALLPTVGIVVGLAELIGELLGVGNGDSAPAPTAADQVEWTYHLAAGDDPVAVVLGSYGAGADAVRLQAAAQLWAWAHGPDQVNTLAQINPGAPPALITNPYREPARTRLRSLGIDPDASVYRGPALASASVR